MPLSAGTRLGSYEILAIVGVGGMGEVYKARDTRLDRIVAIKVLPDPVAGNPELRSRFEREAKVISSLSHAHICTLHDVGSEAGVEFLVMEYLEGETAAQRVAKGPLPIQQVLRYGVEIAEALDCAHRQGITHRDLKPGNVMLTKSGVKLLDFGLAKLKPAAIERGAGSAPTAAADLTGDGRILGTLQYMAPEQVEGKAVDHRADIFALGAILYELATGKKVFEGGSQASLIGAILRDEPQPISQLQPLSPLALDALVATCLAKDPDERWQSAADVGRQLKFMQGNGGSLQTSAARAAVALAAPRRTVALAVAMLLAGAGLATVAARLFTGPALVQPALVSRFTVAPPPPEVLSDLNPLDVGISPDGKRVAFFGRYGGRQTLYVRDLDRLESRAVAQVPPESSSPYFSAEGESIVFISPNEGLVRVAVGGGPRSRLGYDGLFGAAIRPDGTLVYSDGAGLYRGSMSGASSVLLTPARERTSSASEVYAAPTFLPDGRHVLYTLVEKGTEHVGVIDIETHEQRVLVEGGSPYFELAGYLVFARGATLVAAAFDPNRLAVTGSPTAVLQGVRHPTPASAVDYGLSGNGTIAYVPAPGNSPKLRAVVWVDRTGRVTGRAVDDPVESAKDPRLSPNGRRLLLTAGRGEQHLWVYDLGGGPPFPLVAEGDNLLGVWSSDGVRVAFARANAGAGLFTIFTIASDGSDRTPAIVPTGITIAAPSAWTSQGDLILTRFSPPDILVHRIGQEGARDLVATPDIEQYPALSPNEQWLAYATNRAGRLEIWAMRYPDGVSMPVSNGGGTEPVWSRDGKQLFFRQGDAMMSVAVASSGERPFGAVTKLFEWPYFTATDGSRDYDVAPDGRFVMLDSTTPPHEDEAAVVVVQNWGEDLKRLMAAH